MDFDAKVNSFKSIMEVEEEEEEDQEDSNKTQNNPSESEPEPPRLSLSRPLSPLTPSLFYHCLTTLHHQDSANFLSIVISKRLVFTASGSDHVRVWKQPDCIARGNIRTHRTKMTTMVANDTTLFTAHSDHRIRAWSIFTTKKVATLPPTNRSLFSRKPSQHQRHLDTVTCLAIYHEESLLYSASVDRTVKAWRLHDPPTHCCVDSFVAHDRKVNAMVVNQKDGCLFTGSSDWTVKIWQRQGCREYTHALLMVLRFQSSPVNALALSSASSCYLYSGTSDGYINIWEEEDEEEEVTSARYRHGGLLHGHHSAVLCLATVGKMKVISGSEDATIRVWRRDEHCGMSHMCMAVIEGHKGPVRCLAANMEGEEEGSGFLLYSGGLDSLVKVWRVKVVSKGGGGGEEGMRVGGYEMSPVLSPLWVEKRIQGMHMYSKGRN